MRPRPSPARELFGGVVSPAVDEPFHHQVYARVRAAIETGRLRPGDRLPSARSLAHQLAVARGTIDAAYQRLAGEGWVLARGAAGTVVHPARAAVAAAVREPARPVDVTRDDAAPAAATDLASIRDDVPSDALAPFRVGVPALDAFPRKTWARLAARAARVTDAAALVAGDPRGDPALRRALVAYLGVARGIQCTADQVFVTGGFLGALGLVTRALVPPGAGAWVENPGYVFARRALELAGARLVPVPADEQGIDVAAGRRLAPDARLAVVTPTHQFPLGATLTLARRRALLDWARDADAWIVEDDYDAEFRYAGAPLPALKSLDADGRVLYVGTFSKVLFPGLRLGYLVVPPSVAARFATFAALAQPARNAIGEATVAAFMTDGHFARHIRRMRALYAERRAALAAALDAAFGSRLAIVERAGGMHLVARLTDARASDRAWVQRARARGLSPHALSACAVPPVTLDGLLLGFTNVAAADAPAAARRLRDAVMTRRSKDDA
jgi:GntR family transcriptional regulator/MocR family aminotransferase